MIANFRQLRECTSGTAMLEAAVVIPLVPTLMLGVIEFGRAYQDFHTADKSMRSAARYLARVPEPATCGWGFDNAVELAVFGTIAPEQDTPPLLPGWDDLVEADDGALTLLRTPACGVTPDEDEAVVLHLRALIPLQVQLLAALGLPSTITIQVDHEERHIGG